MKSPKVEAARSAIAAAAEGKHSPAEKYISAEEALRVLHEAYERAVEGRCKAECQCEALRRENEMLRRELQAAYSILDKEDDELFKRFTGGNE